MTVKDGIALTLSGMAFLISLLTTYVNVIKREDYLRMVVQGRPMIRSQVSPDGNAAIGVSAGDQSVTFINLGNQPAEITALKLEVQGVDKTNPAGTGCGGGDGREIAYELEPFAIKPGESISRALQFAKRLDLDSTEGFALVQIKPSGTARTPFVACMVISLVTPDTVKDDLKQVMLRGFIPQDTKFGPEAFYEGDTKPALLLRQARTIFW